MSDVRAPAPADAPAAAAVLAALDDPVILLVADEPGQWRISWVNEAYEQHSGWRADEVVGTVPGNLAGPLTDPMLTQRTHAETTATGSMVRKGCILHDRRGRPLLCDLRAGVIGTDEDGREWGFAILHLTNDHFRSLLENVSEAVVVLDRDAVIRYASPSARGLGVDPDSLLGSSVFDLLDPAEHGANAARFAEVVSSPGVHGPWPTVIVSPDGTRHPVEVVSNNQLDDPSVGGIVVTARSAADRLAAEEALERRERRFRALVQHSSDFCLLFDADNICRYASPAVDRALGRTVEGIHLDDTGVLALVDREVVERLAMVRDEPGPGVHVEASYQHPDGTTRWLEIGATNLLHDPDIRGVIVYGSDITERKRNEGLLAAELRVLELIAESHVVTPVLVRIAEVAETFLPGCKCSIGVADDDGVVRVAAAPSLPAGLVALLDAEPPDGPLGVEIRSTHDWLVSRDVAADPDWGAMGVLAKRHGLRACWWFPVFDADDELLGVVSVFHRSPRGPHPTELPMLERLRRLVWLALDRSRFESRLRDQAVQDALTRLPNRALLLDRVETAIEHGRRRQTNTAVLFVDLDQFKIVNDSLGHAMGDLLLRQVADRLLGAVRKGDTVGRFGGDEFLVVVEDVAGEAGAVAAAERLMDALEQPFDIAGANVSVNASIGVALAGPDVDEVTSDALVRNADAAMYRAKDRGRNQVAVFEDTLHAELVRRYELEQGLRGAIERDELVVLYQPKVAMRDGHLEGVEALLRWRRPGHGLVAADELVPIAEETGLIVPIGAHVLREACRQAVSWDADSATADLAVAVNLSARQLADPGLVAVVADTLAETGLCPERLCLEVTESALARDPETASKVLGTLKRLGVRVAIDDFGTGYATLDYVRRFSMADELKIDRSFVAGLADLHSPDAAIVSAAIVLADALGFTTVAEGVETPQQLAVLARLGCASAQGWYFGRPVPPEQIGRV